VGRRRPRNWSACWSQLTTELADCKINGKAGDAYLHVMERWDPTRKADILAGLEAFHERLSPSAGDSPRGILIGELDSHGDSQYGGWIVLRQSRARYFMGRALYDHFKKSHSLPLSGVGSDDRRGIAILAIEKSSKGYLTVVDLAAMLANRQFLPCDSSYEVQMADLLVAAGRSFQKPLRHTDRAAVHPDFVLTDTAPETVIEVLGMVGNAAYDVRLAEKRRHYEAQATPLIEWTPTAAPIGSLVLPPIQ
jgi:hypothetical protein